MVRFFRSCYLDQVSFNAILACIVFCSGCARSLQTIDDARNSFVAGDVISARQSLTKLSESGNQYADVAALDLAMVDLAIGDTKSAERRLRNLRDRFDQQPAIAPVREAASMITDDNARAFHPAGYEQVMIRTMLAVCSLADDGIDAEAYALQATMKQTELAQEADSRGILDAAEVYQPIAVAPYLRGMLREATHHDYDDATKAYQLVSSVQPQFIPAADDIARASGGTHSAPGHGVLYVIACVGRGPILQPTVAETTSTALSIASVVLNAETNQGDGRESDIVLPNIASVKVPRVVIPPMAVAALGVRINGDLYGATQTLTDVGQLAARQVDAEMPWTIARAIVRRTTKELAVTKATDALGLQGTAGSLFHFAAASGWAGIENADTRCWGLLPREIQVFRGELPAGRHTVALEPLGVNGAIVGNANQSAVEIVNGRNHYVVVLCPGPNLYLVQSAEN